MSKQIQNRNILYTLIVLVLLATSGFPSFMSWGFYANLLMLVILCIHASNKRILILPKIGRFSVFISLFALIHLALGHLSFVGAISVIIMFCNLSIISIIMGDKFCGTYIKIIYLFCVISLVIWSLITINPNIYNTLLSFNDILPQFISDEWLENTSNPGTSLYIYYVSSDFGGDTLPFIRNCGPFYEPGLFASYIIIALILNYSQTKQLVSKKNIIFMVTLLTTMSSAGYISLALALAYFALSTNKSFVKIVLLSTIVLLWKPIYELDFMGEKIESNFESGDDTAASRFGAIAYHAEKVAKSPIVGYMGGKLPYTSLDMSLGHALEEHIVSPNGISYAFVYWGIPLAIVYYLMLYKGLGLLTNEKKRWKQIFIFAIILSTAFSQTITTGPILLFIAISAIIHNKKGLSNGNSH